MCKDVAVIWRIQQPDNRISGVLNSVFVFCRVQAHPPKTAYVYFTVYTVGIWQTENKNTTKKAVLSIRIRTDPELLP